MKTEGTENVFVIHPDKEDWTAWGCDKRWRWEEQIPAGEEGKMTSVYTAYLVKL